MPLDEAPWRLVTVVASVSAGALAIVLVTTLLFTVVVRVPTRRLAFADDGITEQGERDRAPIPRSWSWITRFTLGEATLEIQVRPDPMRSLQLAPTQATRLVVDRRAVPEAIVTRLLRLLRTHASHAESP